MKALRSVKGMHDIFPDEMPRWHFVEQTYRELVERYGYGEIRTPILEPLELFVRSIGEATDIVEKEMYAFEDKGGAQLGVRPEGTASVIRAYIQHNLQARQPISKMYYLGPMFRRERPAKGRYRQFYQAGAELVGIKSPAADAELIDMVVQFVKRLGIEQINVQLNTLGDRQTRPRFRAALVDYFTQFEKELCPDCVRRLRVNPLRILDCKVKTCKAIAADAPVVLDHLSEEARTDFEQLQSILDRSQTSFTVVPTMVRGLDYYTSTIFEIEVNSDALGAQASIVGGGRYDDLVEQLGGRSTPAIGYSFGIERLIAVLGSSASIEPRPVYYVAAVGDSGFERASDLTRELRNKGFHVEVAYQAGSLKSQLKRANRLAADAVIIAGDDEAARGAVTLRDMKTGEQQEVPLAELEQRIEARK